MIRFILRLMFGPPRRTTVFSNAYPPTCDRNGVPARDQPVAAADHRLAAKHYPKT